MKLCKISNKGFSEIARSMSNMPFGEETKPIHALFRCFLSILNGVSVSNSLPYGSKTSRSLCQFQHEVFFQHVGGI